MAVRVGGFCNGFQHGTSQTIGSFRCVASKKTSHCAVARGEVDIAGYASLDGVWRGLGLAAPARRALVDAGLTELAQLCKWTRAELASLHGVGPNALRTIDVALMSRGLFFRR